MSLKTDYKDDIYEGSRRWRMTPNEDGTYNISDATSYTQKGDKFGQNDINTTNAAVNRANHVTPVTLLAAEWTGDILPYIQTVSVEGLTVEDNPLLVSMLADGATAETQKAYNKALGIVASGTGTTAHGTATFKVYKLPVIDITVGLKGV